MNLIEEKFIAGARAGDDPGAAARQIFENFDFGDLEILDFDGADSTVRVGTPEASSVIKFYVPSESDSSSSAVMLFRVDFSEKGARVSVYG
jgi:hypothetical protein